MVLYTMNLFKALISLILLFFITACSLKTPTLQHNLTCKENYYSLKSSSCLNQDEMIEYLSQYSVIFIGDHHDEKALHVEVAKLLKALGAKGYHLHVANEWFSPNDNKLLSLYNAHDINESVFINDVNWSKTVGYEFDSYRDIYEGNISLYGINLTRTFRKKISKNSKNIMSEKERFFVNSLDLNTSLHRVLVKPYMNHCEMYEDTLAQKSCKDRMYRVQVAWDSYMAKQSYALSKKVLKSDKDKLIIFAGSMHMAFNAGINMRFSRLSHEPTFTILPLDRKEKSIEVGYSDAVLLYDAKVQEE